MHDWIEFGAGPLFRLCFSLMLLGIIRAAWLLLLEVYEAGTTVTKGKVRYGKLFLRGLYRLVPLGRMLRGAPVYGSLSFVWHIGLILVPIFYTAHVMLWERRLGFGWPTLPERWADYMTLVVVGVSLLLLLWRILSRKARTRNPIRDYFLPILLTVPFISGYICANIEVGARTYEYALFTHVYSANLIMVSIPFSRIAQCALSPLAVLATDVAEIVGAEEGAKIAEVLRRRGSAA